MPLGSPLTTSEVEHNELAVEQAYVDVVYARLEESTKVAQSLVKEGFARGHVGNEGGLVERDAQPLEHAVGDVFTNLMGNGALLALGPFRETHNNRAHASVIHIVALGQPDEPASTEHGVIAGHYKAQTVGHGQHIDGRLAYAGLPQHFRCTRIERGCKFFFRNFRNHW